MQKKAVYVLMYIAFFVLNPLMEILKRHPAPRNIRMALQNNTLLSYQAPQTTINQSDSLRRSFLVVNKQKEKLHPVTYRNPLIKKGFMPFK